MNTTPPRTHDSVDELAARATQLRASLDSTLAELTERASPHHIKAVVGASMLRGTARVVTATKRRPRLLASLGAAGLAVAGALWRRRRNR